MLETVQLTQNPIDKENAYALMDIINKMESANKTPTVRMA